MATLEALKAARKLIEKPENWTQEEAARTIDGHSCEVDSPNACKWCSVGSVYSVTQALPAPVRYDIRSSIQRLLEWEVGFRSVTYFNDHHTHAEVLAVFDAAIAKLEVTA